MDRLDALRAFVLAAERGSLSAAAQSLGRSPASVTRAIDAIEARLGAPVLRRTTRSLKLTEAGERYLAIARHVLAELDEAERATTAVTSEPRGLLAVTAPIAFGSLHVRPILDDFLAAHEDVQARFLLLDRTVSLIEEGVDVAVRIGHLPDSALIATAVGSVRRLVIASPEYLARHGRPKAPKDLATHRCIASTGLTPHDSWSFGARGPGRRVRVHPRLSVNVVDAAIRSAVSGIGVTCALSYQVAEHLASGALVRLLPAFEPPPVPVHLLYPASSARTAKVRAFVAFAAPRLRAVLASSKSGAPVEGTKAARTRGASA
ncbi:LysR family transcriptional regulator [Chondromyces apiculatus]|uniref:Transcriptional regulator, LysR family n=1 Tax=Chondromyces apiculatus DSM 436 TaxID=1192034 RepID=A0A017TG14_9BACT|nr:LysR family transcriptional regulator [Chondromyces apiculatus]EYF08169.1 Transcriptional regulator, LysR family [Chondromyces apiculatus DSM 436]